MKGHPCERKAVQLIVCEPRSRLTVLPRIPGACLEGAGQQLVAQVEDLDDGREMFLWGRSRHRHSRRHAHHHQILPHAADALLGSCGRSVDHWVQVLGFCTACSRCVAWALQTQSKPLSVRMGRNR